MSAYEFRCKAAYTRKFGIAQRHCEENGGSGQNTSAGQATSGTGSGNNPTANVPTIPPGEGADST